MQRASRAMRNLDIWYARLDVEALMHGRSAVVGSAEAVARMEGNIAKARTKDSLKAFSKLTRWSTASRGSSATRR